MKSMTLVLPLAAVTAALSLWGCGTNNNEDKRLLAYTAGALRFCTGPSAETAIDEIFEESNRPNLTLRADPLNNDYYFCAPWNYEKDYNASRRYPLLVYLHGRDQDGYIRNLYYMGYDNSDGYMNDVAGAFKKKYPCFIYVPQEAGSSFDTAKLTNQIDALRAAYRIDDDRLYVHGFSMGGYGAYVLANDYYESTGRIFAGIIMLTGWAPALNSAVAAKAGVWLMVGLQDDADVVASIRDGYAYLRDLPVNAGADETLRPGYPVCGHSAVTRRLRLHCVDIVNRTEFPVDGHFVTEFPFRDPSVMEWLFSQSLQNR